MRNGVADSTVGHSGRAIVLHPYLKQGGNGLRSADACLDEAVGLARAIALDVAEAQSVPVVRPRPATYFGTGTVESLGGLIGDDGIGVAVVDGPLSPVQQRNLERAWKCKVIDRTGLILEIFGERARTREGRLQVELAHLSYQRSRLVRSWTHLERQRGGFGFLGGPGETQIEADRRQIGERIVRIKHELEKVVRTRGLHRAARRRVPYPVVALVGYTNAGKSTLFNRLSRAEVYAENQLFATLDPTMRAVPLPSGRHFILSDTVGFVSSLPTGLVAAFRATLEEVLEADLILHVRDIADMDTGAQKADVVGVLGELGLDEPRLRGMIEVRNKIDRLSPDDRAAEQTRAAQNAGVVALSAASGEGCDRLLALIDARMNAARRILDVSIPLTDGATIAWLYRRGEVLSRRDDEEEAHLRVGLDAADAARLEHRAAHRA